MTTNKPPPAIFRLPPEILVHALAQATPEACAAFSRTCRAARTLVQSTALWRALHLARWDSPTSTRAGEYAFSAQVQRRARATALLAAFRDRAEPIPPAELKPLLETLVDIALSRPPAPPSAADDPAPQESDSLSERWLELWLSPTRSGGETLLALHPTFSRSSARTRSGAKALAAQSPSALVRAARIAQLAAQLHALATPSPLSLVPSIRTAAMETVYERANFLREALYGPFMGDGSGRVDWRKVEAIAIVMSANVDSARTFGWGTERAGGGGAAGAGAGAAAEDGDDPVVPPRGWNSTRPGSASALSAEADPRDWAGVTHPAGWRGTYAFLNFPSWVHWNFHRGGGFVPSLADEHEAVGDCMELQLELLPEGEWPAENGQPDLSDDAVGREDGDDEEDSDWDAGSAEDGGDGSSGDESSDNEFGYFVAADGRSAVRPAQGASGHAPADGQQDENGSEPYSPPYDPVDEDDAPALTAAEFVALAGAVLPGPLPAAPHTAASAAYPPPCLTFRPPSPPTAHPAAVPSSSAAAFPASSSSAAYPKLAFHGTSLPRLGFTGTFTNAGPPSLTPRDRSIRGTVELTPEGHVRWQYLIRYAGADQWSMNGVQLGGPRSRAGVVGIWSSADRAEEGPCGPFWYWPHCPSNAQAD
ncbi:hypothetical protein JCM10450v2_006682 [Rhodotorula kratochvilovae]